MQACHWLEQYLDHALLGDQRMHFEAHLPDCRGCTAAVQEQERLDQFLAEASSQIDLVPAGLTERVRHRLQGAHRRRLAAIATGLAAFLFGCWLLGERLRRPAAEIPEVEVTDNHSPPADPDPLPEPVRVTFPGNTPMVVVAEPVEAKNVTFVWVYRGLREPPPSDRRGEDASQP